MVYACWTDFESRNSSVARPLMMLGCGCLGMLGADRWCLGFAESARTIWTSLTWRCRPQEFMRVHPKAPTTLISDASNRCSSPVICALASTHAMRFPITQYGSAAVHAITRAVPSQRAAHEVVQTATGEPRWEPGDGNDQLDLANVPCGLSPSEVDTDGLGETSPRLAHRARKEEDAALVGIGRVPLREGCGLLVQRREGGGGSADDEDLETSEWPAARYRADVVHAEVAHAVGLRTQLSVEAGEEREVGDDSSSASTGVNVDHRERPEGFRFREGTGTEAALNTKPALAATDQETEGRDVLGGGHGDDEEPAVGPQEGGELHGAGLVQDLEVAFQRHRQRVLARASKTNLATVSRPRCARSGVRGYGHSRYRCR